MSATAVNLLSPMGLRDPMRNANQRPLASEGSDVAADGKVNADAPDFSDALAAADPLPADHEPERSGAAMSETPLREMNRLMQGLPLDGSSARTGAVETGPDGSGADETGLDRTDFASAHAPQAESGSTLVVSVAEAAGPAGRAGFARSTTELPTAAIAEGNTPSAETGAEPGRSGRSGGNGTMAGQAPSLPETPVTTPAGPPDASNDTLSKADQRSTSRNTAASSAPTAVTTEPAERQEAGRSPEGPRSNHGPESREKAVHGIMGPPHAAARGEQPGVSPTAPSDAASTRMTASSPEMPAPQETGRGGDAAPIDDVSGDWGRGEPRGEAARAEQARPDASRLITPRNLSGQMAEAVRVSPDGRVEIALQPEELGRVRLTMHGGEGALHVVVQAERADTEALLRRHIALLRNDLAEIGYADVSFSFDDDRAADDRPGKGPAPGATETARSDITATAATMPFAGTPPARGSLDLRL